MADPSGPFLSVVLPCFNEEKNIAGAVRRVDAYRRLKNQPWEILVVDDGSSDATSARVKEMVGEGMPDLKLLRFEKNRGKGHAVREGMLAASGKFLLLTDVDLSSPIKEADKLVSVLERGADVAIGSRARRSRGADVQQSFRRTLSGRIFNFFVQLLVLPGIADTQCGFKLFKRQAGRDLFSVQKLDGFSFDVEVLWLARRKGYKIAEVPVMWSQGEDSKVSLFRDSFRMLGDLFKIKRLHRA